MLLLFVFLVLCGNCYGEHSIKCGEKGGWSFEESRDGVEGRYELEWCTQRYYKGWSEWSIDLYYEHTQSPNKCHSSSQHSLVREIVNIELENCTVACLSTSIDLIFNGTCYSVVTEFSRQKPNSKNAREKCCVETYTKFVLNNYSMNHFTDSKAVVNVYSSRNHVVAEWFLGYIPATDYTMKVCLDTESFECEELNCTVEGAGRTQIRCPLVPPRGAYELRLAHRAPWAAGALFENVARVRHRSNVRVANSSLPWTGAEAGRGAWGGAALWGALWVALLLLLAASGALLAAARLARPRLAAKLRERHKRREDAAGEGREGGVRERGEREERGRVLLLYARDCAPLLDVVSCLTALLEAAGFQVWDLYAARTARLYAAAPAGWLAAALARRGVRVLLLQTPAAACLCSAHLHHSGRLQQPLLNRRVMYRVPHAGDDLFLLALRHVTSSALAAPDYRKHYVASIDSLEVEMVRDVTPLQRYVLPAAAALLLHHLQLPAATDTPASPAPPSPPPAPDSGELPDTAPLAAPDAAPLAAPARRPAPAAPRPHEPPPALLPHISALTEAVKRLHDYVRQKPDYLDEELIFFD